MSKLRISDSLSLPVDVTTQALAWLGRRGSGKSYGATKLAELLYDASAQAYIQRLSEKGYVTPASGGAVLPTEEGIAALGTDYEPLPTGDELQRYWLDRLPEGERRILDILVSAQGDPIDREILSEKTGYARSSRDAYIQRLSSRRLVESIGRGEVQASKNLFS